MPLLQSIISSRDRLLVLLLVSLVAPLSAAAERPAIVYRWDAAAWLKSYSHTQFSAEPITNSDRTVGARVSVMPRDASNPYNHIVVTGAGLKGGHEYTAAITFSVVEPTTYPTSFYMFARNSAGNQYDIWRTWIGLPGPTRTITLPLDLKAIDAGTWKLHVGISKSGALNINSIVVYSGATSDGVSSYATIQPTVNGNPASQQTQGVSAATGCRSFTAASPAPPTVTVSLADYKLAADVAGAPRSVAVSNAAALQEAINACKAKGPAKLLIPKGTYRLCAASAISIDGLDDLTVDGQGSVFIFERLTKDGPAFSVSNCTRITINNLNLDWDWNVEPIASLGTVSNLTPDRLQCDFTFPDLNATQTSVTRTTPWQSIFAMEPDHLIRNDPNIFHVPKEINIRAGSAANALHATFPKPVPFANGSTYCIRHLYYEMAGFKVANSNDITFDAVNIYSIPGMGWFLGGCMHNLQLRNCQILRAPGSRNPLTTAADGIHVDQFAENLNIENCSITGTGDDAMNIHSECYQGNILTDPDDPTKMTLVNCPAWQLRLKPGDPVEFYNADWSPLNKSGTPAIGQVATVSSVNRGAVQTVIQLTAPLPAGVTAQSIVLNGRFTASNVRISGCNIEYTNGRGILLSAKNATIEACRLRNVYCSGINLESEIVQPLWTEGHGASNVLIRNCSFENDNAQGRYNGAIIYTNAHFPWGPTTATLYEQITIENNRFLNCPGPAVSLANCSNVLVRSNQMKETEPVPSPSRYVGTLLVTDSSNVALGGNQWVNALPAASAYGVVYDPATTSSVSPGINALTNLGDAKGNGVSQR